MKQTDAERVAAAMDTTVATLRQGLEQGIFPFGGAVLKSTRHGKPSYSYLLYKAAVKNYLGVDLINEVTQFEEAEC